MNLGFIFCLPCISI